MPSESHWWQVIQGPFASTPQNVSVQLSSAAAAAGLLGFRRGTFGSVPVDQVPCNAWSTSPAQQIGCNLFRRPRTNEGYRNTKDGTRDNPKDGSCQIKTCNYSIHTYIHVSIHNIAQYTAHDCTIIHHIGEHANRLCMAMLFRCTDKQYAHVCSTYCCIFKHQKRAASVYQNSAIWSAPSALDSRSPTQELLVNSRQAWKLRPRLMGTASMEVLPVELLATNKEAMSTCWQRCWAHVELVAWSKASGRPKSTWPEHLGFCATNF